MPKKYVDGVLLDTTEADNALIAKDSSSESQNAHAAWSGRCKRDALLEQTDVWALSDRTMTSQQTTYRQALRDITAHANWPNLSDSDWPTKP